MIFFVKLIEKFFFSLFKILEFSQVRVRSAVVRGGFVIKLAKKLPYVTSKENRQDLQ